jgi:DNA replication and repair protein RecF
MVNIRSFESLHIELGPKFNVFIGKNGAGKTSILEAIDVLSRGKSFRTSNLTEIIRQNQTDLAIASSVISADKNEISLSLTRKKAVTELKVNSFVTSKWSEITSYLPIISIHPESYIVITGGPNERRKYIDWGLFHVEPSFKTSWSSYVRALKQRNVCLRNKQINDAKQWHGVLNEYGLNIHHSRLKYLKAITPIIQFYASKLNLNQNIDIGYQQGWSSEYELLDSLERELKPEDLALTTNVGPHRANLSIKWHGKKFATTSSRGQQKALAIAMYLAQSQYMVDHFSKNSVYLVDELPAELDQSTCQQVLLLLSELNSQVVITSVSEHYLRDPTPENTKWFHVEHGHASPIRPML